jgi:hypothetical protein
MGIEMTSEPGTALGVTVSRRVASLTDAESQQVLQYLAGFSPDTVNKAIAAIKALQLRAKPSAT